MTRIFSIYLIAAWLATATVTGASAADSGAGPSGIMTSALTLGTVSIVPEPMRVNGELILKIVALNQSRKPATFGPEDIGITTADGRTVPLMSLDALIARLKSAAGAGRAGSGAYNSSYTAGAVTSYNPYGQPDVSHFTGSSRPLGGQVSPEAPVGGAARNGAALERQVASLEAAILRDVTIAPGEVKGGEVISQRIRFHWREKRTLHIEVRFNGERHEFELPAPPNE